MQFETIFTQYWYVGALIDVAVVYLIYVKKTGRFMPDWMAKALRTNNRRHDNHEYYAGLF